MNHPRRVARIDALTPLHEDAIRSGRATILPGQWARHDPFLALMNDRFGPGAFGPHPHRGFETITYVIDGQLAHSDNRGGSGILGAGDVQWMTAGRGVVHDEQPAPGHAQVHVLQLWLNLAAADKLADFRYQDLRGAAMPVRHEDGVEVRVFSGQSGGVQGPAQNHVPVTLLDIRMPPGSQFSTELPAADNAFIYLIAGDARIGADATPASGEHTVWLDAAPETATNSEVRIQADTAVHALLLSGAPLREPVAAHGPFVMNSQQQIFQAIADFQRTGFAD